MKTERKNKPPETKQRLVDAATELMLRRGYAATTVDEMCARAKLTKGSFFHYFKSKEHIGEEALRQYCAEKSRLLRDGTFSDSTDPLDRFNELIDLFQKMSAATPSPQSCLLGNLSQELSTERPKLRRSFDTYFREHIDLVASLLSDAKAQRKPKTDFDPVSVATMFFSLVQGSIIISKVRQNSNPFRENLEHFRNYVNGLFAVERARKSHNGVSK